jgi:hypothetical protein
MKKLWPLLIVLFAPAAGAAYKCVDERGLTHIGDTPPAGCAAVMMYEVNRSGMVLRAIEPTPTPEQLKLRNEEASARKEAQRAAAELKRKDDALLATFSGEREFDVVRDRNIEPLRGRVANAHERLKAIDKRQKELEDEMEFYKAGKSSKAKGKTREAPFILTSEMQRITAEKATLESGIAANEKEIEQLRAKFDSDKKRWVALKSGGAVSVAPTPATATPAAKPETAGDRKPAKKY